MTKCSWAVESILFLKEFCFGCVSVHTYLMLKFFHVKQFMQYFCTCPMKYSSKYKCSV